MKMLWFFLGFAGSLLFFFPSTSAAAPHGGGGGGGGFRGSGFRGPFIVRNGGRGFRTGAGFRRGRPFFARQTFSPVYWYPFCYWPDYYPLDYSLLDNDAPDYSAVSVPSENLGGNASTNPSPVVVVINAGSTRSAEPSSGGYASNSYVATTPGGDQGNSAAKANEQQSAGAQTPKAVSPVAQQPAPAAAQRSASQAPPGNSDRYVLVTWLNDGGKDIIYVQDTVTNQVQKVTSEPNRNNFRIVEVHPNSDPEQFEAIISNGSAQIPVRFRY
ncbi:MAG TPA: hypothetical protein VE860_15730 [Chthoniobacterales bacterium]|nr:hypothetical protein [Chthoniobacterales bacterium]